MSEGVLYENIKGGDSNDAKWVLSRLGKNRGYVERSEVTGADGEVLIVKRIVEKRDASQDD